MGRLCWESDLKTDTSVSFSLNSSFGTVFQGAFFLSYLSDVALSYPIIRENVD